MLIKKEKAFFKLATNHYMPSDSRKLPSASAPKIFSSIQFITSV